ncbi:EscE/YscE/SsaE family type III secretion system needle protein co-chaperone, partial [Salmonella enterica subsp. enterica serovar Kentucky]|nr:EscE/YscE/SsaE family type III secretion system needle protein co-chaperone [Salmonella enterica subsp. enterica serovar Kentucky]
ESAWEEMTCLFAPSLEENNGKLQDPQQYQQNTLLLEAIEQAENIINIIYYRYHNSALVVSEQE